MHAVYSPRSVVCAQTRMQHMPCCHTLTSTACAQTHRPCTHRAQQRAHLPELDVAPARVKQDVRVGDEHARRGSAVATVVCAGVERPQPDHQCHVLVKAPVLEVDRLAVDQLQPRRLSERGCGQECGGQKEQEAGHPSSDKRMRALWS